MARASALGWGWSPEARVVTPRGDAGQAAAVPPTEDQLNRLTDFIAFLEN